VPKIRRIALAAVALAVLAVAGGTAFLWAQGYRVYVIHTGSMTPTYTPGYLMIDAPARDGYHPGDVITFRHSAYTTDVVTHRITHIMPNGLIHTKGDGNRTADVWQIRPDQVRGRVIAGIPLLGYLAVFLQQPSGIGSLATAAFMSVLLWGLFFANDSPGNAGPLGRHRRLPARAQTP
jgi:signal peptidase